MEILISAKVRITIFEVGNRNHHMTSGMCAVSSLYMFAGADSTLVSIRDIPFGNANLLGLQTLPAYRAYQPASQNLHVPQTLATCGVYLWDHIR